MTPARGRARELTLQSPLLPPGRRFPPPWSVTRITGGWRVEGVPIALSVLACSRIDPGISHEKAEAILRAFDFTDIELPPSPEGWSGTAVPASGGYRIRATLPDGVLKPFRSYLR